jgi:uncharacterized protein YcfJ
MKNIAMTSLAIIGIATSSGAFAQKTEVPIPPVRSILLAQSNGAAGGAAAGAATGAVGGAIVGGPVGAVVGGAAGAVVGGVTGGLTTEDRTYVRTYVEKHPQPSVTYEQDVVVGAEWPGTVKYYRIEGRPELKSYEYAVVNDHTVLVDSQTRRIVEVLD